MSPCAILCGDVSRNDLLNHLPVIDIQPLPSRHFQLARVQAQLLQNRGVEVGHVVPVLDGVETDLVRGAVGDAALDAAAGQPDAEPGQVVVAVFAVEERLEGGGAGEEFEAMGNRLGELALLGDDLGFDGVHGFEAFGEIGEALLF